MMKKILALLLALLFLFPAAALGDDEPETVEDPAGYIYTVNDDGAAEIVGYKGKKRKLTIPDTLDGHTVKSIADNAFRGTRITDVTVPDSVGTIGMYAFGNCSGLTKVVLPDHLEMLGEGAFENCNHLTSVNLPDGLESIGDCIFSHCSTLKKVTVTADHPLLELVDGVLFNRREKRLLWYPETKKGRSYAIPEGTRSIGDYAFGYHRQLTDVTMPDSVEEIGLYAFAECPALQKINISAGVSELDRVFVGSKNLSEIRISPNSEVFYDTDGIVFTKSDQMLVLYPAGRKDKRYEIPEGTQGIGKDAFEESAFTEIVIPASVKIIGHRAFYHCNKLKSVAIPEGVRSLYRVFESCDSLTEVRLPRSLSKVYANPFTGCKKLKTIVLDEDHPAFTLIDGSLVCTKDMSLVWYPISSKAKKYTVPAGILIIGEEAFQQAQLTELILPEGVEVIQKNAFSDCTKLKRLVMPASLEKIEISAFHTNHGLNRMKYVVVEGSYADRFCQAINVGIQYAP